MGSFVASLTVLSCIHAAVFVVERIPRYSFRPMAFHRAFIVTDLTWYGIVVGMSAVSILLFRPVFDGVTVEPIARHVRDLSAPLRFVTALLVFDLVSYWLHRALHRSDLMWDLHKVHHSSLALDGLAATRQHIMENLVRFIPSQLMMFLIGIPTAQVALATALGAGFAIIAHSNLKLDLRWMETVVVTPRLHRRHHIPSTSMANYGGIFTVWDRAFGTFVSRDTTAEERFGCPGEDSYPQRFHESLPRPPRDIAARLRHRRHPKVAAGARDADSEREGAAA